MPTYETQIEADVIQTTWEAPLKSNDLSDCFAYLATAIDEADSHQHILFNIEKSGNIPAQAPFLFIRSGIANNAKLGRIAVIGTNPVAQILAQMAVKMTSHNILFFANQTDAMAYLIEVD